MEREGVGEVQRRWGVKLQSYMVEGLRELYWTSGTVLSLLSPFLSLSSFSLRLLP